MAPERVVRVGAYALCRDDDGRVLLGRLAPGYPASAMWSLPGGGVEFGEDPGMAVLRELEEETGLAGEALGVLGVWSRRYPPSETQSGNDVHFVGIVYAVRAVGGELRVEVGGSTDAVAWFTDAELATTDVGELARYGLSLRERVAR
jgi:8-oxo-dGTP diphosphatase